VARNSNDKKSFVDAYSSYLPTDFKYGDASSTNLNPRRETPVQQLDVLKKIEIRLQEITDDLVRKQVAPRPPVDRLRGGIGGSESLPIGLPLARRAAVLATGGMDNALIFPVIKTGLDITPLDLDLEFRIGTFPGIMVDELDLPPELDCDAILSEFFGIDGLKSDANMPKGSALDNFKNQAGLGDGNGDLPTSLEGSEDGLGEDDDVGDVDDELDLDPNDMGFDDDMDDEDDEDFDDGDAWDDDYDDPDLRQCAVIELGWLKIILVIVRVVAILKKIIDLVLSILMPIIEIVRLAVGVWLNPVNIAKIAQLIIQLIIALIVMIVSMIIQLLWDLLNLDCITDSTQATIDEIAKALSAFASVMSAFNPTAVSMMMKDFNDRIMDPLADIGEQLKANAKGWMDMKDQVKQLFTDPSVIKGVIDDIGKGVVDGVKQEQGDKIGKVGGIVNDAKDLFSRDGSLGKVIAAFNSFKDTRAMSAQARRTANSAESISQSLQFVGIQLTSKEEG
jgi:hypothetical protein